jgi:hypothetical protein
MWPCGSISLISSIRCGGAVVSTLLLVAGRPAAPAPLRLAIYYGYPSLVNGAGGDLAAAVSDVSHYDVLVLGDGLEFDTADGGHAGAAEHAFAARLVRQLAHTSRRPAVFGYVDLGRTQALSLAEIVDRIGRWAMMGIHGVFLDEAGYDFGVTRERQNQAVLAAHARGLRVCFNAFNPDDVFGDGQVPINAVGGGNPAGVKSLLSERDAILLESFAVGGGVTEPAAVLTRRVRAALAGRRRFGTRVFAIATGDDITRAQYGWWVASAFGLDAYGWSGSGYGAATSRLRWAPPPDAEAALGRSQFTDADAQFNLGAWRRETTAGTIVVSALDGRGTLDAHGKDNESWNGRTR